MNKLKILFYPLITSFLLITISSCEETFSAQDELNPVQSVPDFRGPQDGRVGDFKEQSDGHNYPYPEIIEQTFIPSNDLFAHTKCLTWKITWPDYNYSADPDKIPTVFSLDNGALNSFNYLNGTDPQNTYKANFSLYFDNKIESPNNMWSELQHTFGGVSEMQTTYFAKSDQTAKIIEGWVKERPSLFESYWPVSNEIESEYNQGDIFLFKLTDDKLYGGIRIVTVTPRVIEVYLAVPNIETSEALGSFTSR